MHEISQLEPYELESIDNRKYFDFSKKTEYKIGELFEKKIHEEVDETLSRIFFLSSYTKKFKDLS